jgi:galactose-1-phosphate uridylyltransferase
VRAAFGNVYRDVLRRLDGLFGASMPYIAAWQQAPVRGHAARAEFALHLPVLPAGEAGEVKFLAGTESAAGVRSNNVLRETAARRPRDLPAEPVTHAATAIPGRPGNVRSILDAVRLLSLDVDVLVAVCDVRCS